MNTLRKQWNDSVILPPDDVKFILRSIAFKTQVSWKRLKMVEAAGGGIEDLNAETQFFLENDHAYKLQRAWKRYHDAEENLDLLDADDRELLQKKLLFQVHHAKRLRECERAGKTLS